MTAPLPHVRLVIMDGWGIAPPGPGNAIAQARTPVLDELLAGYPHAALDASGAVIELNGDGGDADEPYRFDLDYCKGCGICVAECPCGAIELEPEPS